MFKKRENQTLYMRLAKNRASETSVTGETIVFRFYS